MSPATKMPAAGDRSDSLWVVVTVTHNSREALMDHWSGIDTSSFRWIVVDNGSTDDSAEVARRLGAEVVPSRVNLGFARANNLAVAGTTERFILFANPDLRISPTDLDVLGKRLCMAKCVVSPRLLNPDGTRQSNARGLPTVRAKLLSRFRPASKNATGYLWPEPDNIEWFMGAAVAVDRLTFSRIGGWDEGYFLYFEDHEFGLRAKKRGYALDLVESVQWTHGWERAPVKRRGYVKLLAATRELRAALRFYLRHPDLVSWAVPPSRDAHRK